MNNVTCDPIDIFINLRLYKFIKSAGFFHIAIKFNCSNLNNFKGHFFINIPFSRSSLIPFQIKYNIVHGFPLSKQIKKPENPGYEMFPGGIEPSTAP